MDGEYDSCQADSPPKAHAPASPTSPCSVSPAVLLFLDDWARLHMRHVFALQTEPPLTNHDTHCDQLMKSFFC